MNVQLPDSLRALADYPSRRSKIMMYYKGLILLMCLLHFYESENEYISRNELETQIKGYLVLEIISFANGVT